MEASGATTRIRITRVLSGAPRTFRTHFKSRRPAKREQEVPMAKKSRGGRTTAAKKRAAKSARGKGRVRRRKAGRKIMET